MHEEPRSGLVAVAGGIAFAHISAGLHYTCGIRRGDFMALCWGLNDWGQPGDGTTVSKRAPARVLADFGFAWISAGVSGTCGVRRDNGQTVCFGGEWCSAACMAGRRRDRSFHAVRGSRDGQTTCRLVRVQDTLTCEQLCDAARHRPLHLSQLALQARCGRRPPKRRRRPHPSDPPCCILAPAVGVCTHVGTVAAAIQNKSVKAPVSYSEASRTVKKRARSVQGAGEGKDG